MEIDIVDFLRLELKAKHNRTGQIVKFPVIHILVEKISDGTYNATCLEYSQAYDDEKSENAVVGVIKFMYRYFFSVLKKEGREGLYLHTKCDNNDYLWAEVREYMARKYDKNLEFVEKSFVDEESLNRIRNDLVKENEINESSLAIPMSDHNKILNAKEKEIQEKNTFIERILHLFRELQNKKDALNEENQKLKFGLMNPPDWEEEISNLDIWQDSSFREALHQ